MIATIQSMIDRSLGKQPLADNSNAPKSNVASTSQHNAMPPKPLSTPTAQYNVPMKRRSKNSRTIQCEQNSWAGYEGLL